VPFDATAHTFGHSALNDCHCVAILRQVLHSVHGLAFHAVPFDATAHHELLPMPIAFDDNRRILVRKTVMEEPEFLQKAADATAAAQRSGAADPL
jgi:hypothetical protein